MYIKVNQISNDLYEDKFEILDQNNNKIGHASLNGSMGSMEASININYMNNNILLKFGYNSLGERIKGVFSTGIFRPYNIIINNTNMGRIGTMYIKEDFFTRINIHEMTYNNKKYNSYYYGLKEKGLMYSFYEDSKIIGQILKPAEIINGLNNYELKACDDGYMILLLLECFYIHVFSYYKPSVKITSGKVVNYSKTISKLLEEKYNPDFWNNN